MSALDQAFIKAYAKDGPPLDGVAGGGLRSGAAYAPAAAPMAGTAVGARGVRAAADADAIERIYHDAVLYRVDPPRAAARRSAVPTPHIQLPPRTSPRRNVRRSMLQLLGQLGATPMPVEPPPRQSSVIRPPVAERRSRLDDHGSRRLAPPARRTAPAARPPETGPSRRAVRSLAEIANQLAPPPTPPPLPREQRVELRPEIVFDPPQADEPMPVAAPEPKLPAPPPNIAPLNLAREFQPQFEVHGHWEADAAQVPGSLVVLPEPADLHITQPAPLVELKLDALPVARPLEIEPPAPTVPSFRVDPPHAAVAAKPHAHFAPKIEADPAADEPADATAADRDEPQAKADDAAAPVAQPSNSAAQELDFADRESAAADAATEPATNSDWNELAPSPRVDDAQSSDCVPLWEVDRFQWPITVERLVSDKDGYFAQASGRLLAAVRDGLRTLAVSGSRRGEGRTTLALALARSAANAGIQVAVIDADFARPQLAARIGLEVNHGWQDAATGLVPLSETAVRSLSDNITILPLEASAARTNLSLADPRVTATLRAAAATFELVIVDLGPLTVSDEPLFPADEACPLDAAIVVRDLRYASAAESEDIGQRLMAAGVEAVGIAENFVVLEEIPVTSV
ncbi:MAG: P-loop NTPase [Planctomycetaceae bacterium]|nr:P-loop NTPase [Planctomycetaceae bacterium]